MATPFAYGTTNVPQTQGPVQSASKVPAVASTNPQANVANSTYKGLTTSTGAPMPVSPPLTQSTTTLSSDKSKDVAGIQQKTNDLSKTGVTTQIGPDGNPITTDASGKAYTPTPSVTGTKTNPDGSTTTTYSDGSEKTQQPSNNPAISQGGYIDGTYYPKGSNVPQNSDGTYATPTPTDPVNDQILSSLNSQIAQNDSFTASMIANIQNQYNQLIQQQQQTNTGAQAGLNTFLLKSGSLQGTQSGQNALNSQVSYGIQQIANLNTKEQSDILAAQQAGQNNDYQLQDRINQNIQNTRAEKQAAATKLNDQIAAANQKLADQQFAVQQAQTKSMQDIMTTAAGNYAPPSVQQAIGVAKDVNSAIQAAGAYLASATGQLGDYYQYMRDATNKGLTPQDYTTWKATDDAKQNALAYQKSYSSAAGSAAGSASAGSNPKVQQALEQQYRGILAKEFSARTGALGIENAKVNQANHLDSLFQQYYDPKSGNYNIPQSQYAELAIGLANLIAGNGTASEGTINSIMQATASGDINKALTYATGTPQNGSTQSIFKNLLDSVDRQAETASSNRQVALNNMKDLAPTDLDPARIDQLNKATEMVPYNGENRIYQSKVDSYVKANVGLKFKNGQDVQQTVSKAYTVPGVTDQDVWDYIQSLQ